MLNVDQAASKYTIDVLQQIFAMEGLPDTIVIDNGRQFVSSEFDDFCVYFNLKQLTLLVLYPATNGEAKRFVQTFKYGLEKNIKGEKYLIDNVRFSIATYLTSPHLSLDWSSLAEILHGRQPKSLLSFFYRVLLLCINRITKLIQKLIFTFSQILCRRYCICSQLCIWCEMVSCSYHKKDWFNLIRTDCGIWQRHQNQLQPRLCDLLSDNRNTNSERNDTKSISSRLASELQTMKLTMIMKFPLATSKGVGYLARNRRTLDFYQAGFV